ncbi:hypothetical protein J437_LFUL006259 [Ladona fulva]|uniref:Uncharacterized protein n=1 Tax=Ladona fulva TaxID=123851 RepID=A0A8K0NXP3_LADFU|nr:hypothetical protein J437_LFUL006259 [Ladona fulva]
MSNGLLGLQYKSSGDAVVLSDVSIKDSPGKITGFIFGGFALAAVIVLLVIAYKDQRYIVGEGPSFMFSRFENAPSTGDGPVIRVWGEEVGEAAEEDPGKGGSSWVTMEPVLPSSTPQAFDNPMYNKPGMEEERKDTKAVMSSTVDWNKMKDGSGQSVTMENPVYSALSQKVNEEETTAKTKEEEEKKPKHAKRKPKGRKEKTRKEIITVDETDNGTDSDTMTVIEELDS